MSSPSGDDGIEPAPERASAAVVPPPPNDAEVVAQGETQPVSGSDVEVVAQTGPHFDAENALPVTLPNPDSDEDVHERLRARSARIYLETAKFQAAENERLSKLSGAELDEDDSDPDHPISVAFREMLAKRTPRYTPRTGRLAAMTSSGVFTGTPEQVAVVPVGTPQTTATEATNPSGQTALAATVGTKTAEVVVIDDSEGSEAPDNIENLK